MSDRPTPETDAFVQQAFGDDGLGADYDAYIAAVRLSRKLERERDEAREEVERQRERVKLWCAIHEKVSEGREDAERERDEAREIADQYRTAFCSAKGNLVPQVFPWEAAK